MIDSHPEHHHDLRLHSPFPELKEYAMGLDMSEGEGKMDSMEHSHVPWVVLLVRAVGMWEVSHRPRYVAGRRDG